MTFADISPVTIIDEPLAVPPEDGSSTTYILVGVFVGVAVLLAAAIMFYFFYWRKRNLTSLEVGMTQTRSYQRM